MAHVLARITGVDILMIKQMLTEHAPLHAKEGLYLEHVWQNLDKVDEVLFLFRADDLEKAKKFIEKTHEQARKENPSINLPAMLFLKN